MAQGKKGKASSEQRSTLYNVSSYARAHYASSSDTEPYGVTLSGYTGDSDTGRTYVNLWVNTQGEHQNGSLIKKSDGTWILRIKLLEVERMQKKKDADDDEEDEG